MAVIVRSKFSTIFRLKWPNLRLLCIAQFSSANESGESGDLQSTFGSSENSVQSDGDEHASSTSPSSSKSKTGLEKAIEMFDRVEKMTASESIQSSKTGDEKPVSFARMLRQSKFVAIGKPAGRVVVGTIFDTLNDDLYIDFGGKFYCVCKAPRTNTEWVFQCVYMLCAIDRSARLTDSAALPMDR